MSSSSPSSPSSPPDKSTEQPVSFSSLFVSKEFYAQVASEFHPYHEHDLNVFLHVLTTSLGIWGAVQAAVLLDCQGAVLVYGVAVLLTTPLFFTGLLHSVLLAVGTFCLPADSLTTCALAMAAGYGLQDLAHWLTGEKTYMGSYIYTQPSKLIVHTVFLLPLVLDALLMRHCFLPWWVSRNRVIRCTVSETAPVEALRTWIQQNVAETKETTHVWPHVEKKTSVPTRALEDDEAILQAFRTVFAAKHFDVKVVQPMNEIYVTAVGSKKEINSDAVFYTPHTDGPYWFLPGASLYRVLVGLTPNTLVRTRFNLQHESCDKVIDLNQVLGFDYNRELHWIDHTSETPNKERRSLLKLHFVVYPKGWHWYGALAAFLNTRYNTWARGNFLKTLTIGGMYEYVLAWWIWLTTWLNALFEEYVGWNNLVYLVGAHAMGPTSFLVLTSFRHYLTYMTTFAYRQPPVAYGYFVRDAKLYKTLALYHLGKRLLSLVSLPEDAVGVACVMAGFCVTMLATARLGMVRTYFGSELGFVKPEWISGFPYGYIAHPMIVGQLFAFGSFLYFWRDRLDWDNRVLLGAHMACYGAHMVQEMLTSSY